MCGIYFPSISTTRKGGVVMGVGARWHRVVGRFSRLYHFVFEDLPTVDSGGKDNTAQREGKYRTANTALHTTRYTHHIALESNPSDELMLSISYQTEVPFHLPCSPNPCFSTTLGVASSIETIGWNGSNCGARSVESRA